MIFRFFKNPIQIISSYIPNAAEGVMCVAALVIAILFAISIHEFAHAFVAYKHGDNTAKLFGRMTINPIKHLDFLGFAMLVIAGFGWAKPVPVNSYKMKNPKTDMIWVSLAGIGFNIVMSFLSVGAFMLMQTFMPVEALVQSRFLYLIYYLVEMIFYFAMMINLGLALFNLIPLFPLDGYRVLEIFVGSENKFMVFLRQYSCVLFIIIIILSNFPFSPFSWVINTLSDGLLSLFTAFWRLFGLVM